MNIKSKDKAKKKVYKKFNTNDNDGKTFSKNIQMQINISSADNNELNKLEKKFFSDKTLHNENLIKSKLFEKKSEIKENKIKEEEKQNIDDKKDEENKNEENNIIENGMEKNIETKENNIDKEKVNEKVNEKMDNKDNQINKEIENNNDKDNLNESEIVIEIKNEKSGLELIQEKNDELQNKVNNLLLEIDNEKNNMIKTQNECTKKINDLNLSIKKQTEINKKSINNISNLQKELNNTYDKLVKYLSKNKYNFYNHHQKKIEKELKIKESQYNYNQKVTQLLIKEIHKYNQKIKINSNIDENIKQENPLVINKEDEFRFILNKLNEEIDILKQDIQGLKKIRNKHIMCNKIEQKLFEEIEFYKVEKQKKLDYIESLNKFKYFQKLRKRKVLIEKEEFTNLSTNNLLSDMKIISEQNKIENNLENNEIKKNDKITPMLSLKNVEIKKLKIPLSVSKSSNNINIFQKAKQYEMDKKAKEMNEKKSSLKEILNEDSFNEFGLFRNKLFTSEEKSIFKNYNFIPEEKVDSYEQKYTDILEQISQTERKMKKLGKKNDKKLLNIKCEIIKNDKKKKDLKKICVSNSIIIKKKAKKILQLKALIKQKLKEEKELDIQLKKQNLKSEKLKEILEISDKFEDITTYDNLNNNININPEYELKNEIEKEKEENNKDNKEEKDKVDEQNNQENKENKEKYNF